MAELGSAPANPPIESPARRPPVAPDQVLDAVLDPAQAGTEQATTAAETTGSTPVGEVAGSRSAATGARWLHQALKWAFVAVVVLRLLEELRYSSHRALLRASGWFDHAEHVDRARRSDEAMGWLLRRLIAPR